MRRRTFLQGVAGTAAGLALAACTADRVTTAPARRLVVAHGATTLSGTVEAAAVDVAAGAVLELDPDVSTTLTVTGNVVVEGLLRMRPRRPDVVHTLRFRDVDESRFVGGGGYPVATDVGLWVVGAGALDLAGTPRAGWNRTGRDPSWRAGTCCCGRRRTGGTSRRTGRTPPACPSRRWRARTGRATPPRSST